MLKQFEVPSWLNDSMLTRVLMSAVVACMLTFQADQEPVYVAKSKVVAANTITDSDFDSVSDDGIVRPAPGLAKEYYPLYPQRLNQTNRHVAHYMQLPIDDNGIVQYAPPLTHTITVTAPNGTRITFDTVRVPEMTVIDSGAPADNPSTSATVFHHVNSVADLHPSSNDPKYQKNIITDPYLAGCSNLAEWHVDLVDDDDDPTDESGHGSAVSSLALSTAAVNARVFTIRVLNEKNAGSILETAEAIRRAADCRPPVINLSLGQMGKYEPSVLREAVEYAVSKGKIIFAAGGNYKMADAHWPAANPAVIGVGGYQIGGSSPLRWWDSNNLLPSNFSITAVADRDMYVYGIEGKLAVFCCTSAATPRVAGVASTLLSLVPDGVSFTQQDLYRALSQSPRTLIDAPQNMSHTRPVQMMNQTFTTESGDTISFFARPVGYTAHLPLILN